MYHFVLKDGSNTLVPKVFLDKLDLFKGNQRLLEENKYRIASDVSVDDLGFFLSRLYGAESNDDVADFNAQGLRALCDELGFSGLNDELDSVLRRGCGEGEGAAVMERPWIERMFPFDPTKPLDGIAAYLARACGNNVHQRGIVVVTGSSCLYTYGAWAHNAIDLSSRGYFRSNDEANSFLCYDFKERRVSPSSYSIQSVTIYPRSWVCEVSNDGSLWKVVDSRDNTDDLKDEKVPCNFTIAKPESCRNVRFVRLRQTGPNSKDGNWFALRSWEIFGTLSSPPRPLRLPGKFEFYDLEPLNGIIAHLTRECGGNVHQKGVVEVTASYERQPCYIDNVVDLSRNTIWVADDMRNPEATCLQGQASFTNRVLTQVGSGFMGQMSQTVDYRGFKRRKLMGRYSSARVQ